MSLYALLNSSTAYRSMPRLLVHNRKLILLIEQCYYYVNTQLTFVSLQYGDSPTLDLWCNKAIGINANNFWSIRKC